VSSNLAGSANIFNSLDEIQPVFAALPT
jgi:hypothetical protein